jgi:hypothetical protein
LTAIAETVHRLNNSNSDYLQTINKQSEHGRPLQAASPFPLAATLLQSFFMATDGPKIIDGDIAHDTYWGIMDLYDSNADIDTIQKEIPFVRHVYGIDDDFHHEVFVTSYALAFWEIGAMNNEILNEVGVVIDQGAYVTDWAATDPKAGRARQKELDKLWKKISQPNFKVRARKKYRLITNLYFQADELLAFKLRDNHYRAVICARIDQYRGQCNYILIPTTYKSEQKPTPGDLLNYNIAGLKIGSGYDVEMTKQQQPGVEELWKLFPNDDYFFFGLVQLAVDHKDLIHFKNHFEKVGTLKIKDSFKASGSFGYEENFERFEDIFDDLDQHLKIFGYYKFPVIALCET